MSPSASLHFCEMSHLGKKKKKKKTICRRPATIVSDTVLDKGGHLSNKLRKHLLCQYCHKRSMWACVNVTLCLKHGCSAVFVVFLVLIFLALVVFSIMNLYQLAQLAPTCQLGCLNKFHASSSNIVQMPVLLCEGPSVLLKVHQLLVNE